MKIWAAFKAALFAGATIVTVWHWSVVEAYAEPIPAIIATDSTAAPAEDIFFVERVPEGHWVNTGRHRITHYCPCRKCNGKNAGRTASGAPMTAGRTVATSGREFEFGTKLLINGNVYTVEDRGVGRGCIDILCETHSEALRRGMYHVDVFQWVEYPIPADGKVINDLR